MALVSPNPGAYQIPTGILYIAEYDLADPPTYPTNYADVGEIADLKLKVDVKNLDHFARRSGSKTKDKTAIIETGYTGSMVLDEITQANLAKFFSGTIEGNIVHINKALNKEWALHFEGTNLYGERERVILHRCQLSANGEFALVAGNDAWNQLSFTISGLADLTNNPTNPYGDIEILTTTTA